VDRFGYLYRSRNETWTVGRTHDRDRERAENSEGSRVETVAGRPDLSGADGQATRFLQYSSTVEEAQARQPGSGPHSPKPAIPEEIFIVSDKITHVSDASFEQEVINAGQPVLVDYWAEWCGPCKMIDPLLHELADDYDGRIKIAKVNIDENQQITSQFKIRGIPTLMVFNEGKVQGMKVGAVTKGVLKEFIEEHI